MTKIAYLGPEGTFTEQAANCFAGTMELNGMSLYPLTTIEDVFRAVGSGDAEYGVVPVENSIEGAINTTVDTLIFDSDLFILKQLDLPITQCMMVGKDCDGPEYRITKILSHPQALAQSRKFISASYPDAVTEATSSTAEAAKFVSQYSPEKGEVLAAVGPKASAERYGLSVIHEGVQENKSNTTQFILLTRTDTSEPKIGCSTGIVFSTEDRPGELYKILDIFSIWGLNMTKIMSRPTKNRRGEYVFLIEVSGYDDVGDVKDALRMVERKTSFFKNLGSYRMIDPDPQSEDARQ